ncbi:MAG: uncharacterized protein QOG54_451 [Actinomycetota bacterium]|jgi:uncharacterized protein with von Willebrand factor type A (vWA) domain|nr:uncharacterized protein [Actinomycetota bacterium]
MLDRVLDFTHALREAGIPVSISETIDSLKALEHIPFENKGAFKAAFATTMIKSDAHGQAFNTLFDLYFGTGRGPQGLAHDEPEAIGRDAVTEEVFQALLSGDANAMGQAARRAVGELGRLGTARSEDWYSQYEVMRALDLTSLLARLMREAGDVDDALSPLERRLLRDEFERRIRDFRDRTLNETRRRVAEHRGPEAVARYAVSPLPEDVNFLSATADMAELRRAIRPLARKLAARMAMKRRRASIGQLDMRRTIRHSLSTGGVPLDLAFKHKPPHRPELFVLCDISGSVARFARFALMLTHSLSAQFSRVRSFAFVDTIDEVTRFFEHEDFFAGIDAMNAGAEVVWHDGHSDYGTSLARFLETYGKDIGPRTTLLILGDARNNYRDRKTWALKELSDRARHSYWLNPEGRQDWDTGDSTASEYAAHVDEMVEVRNVRQLEDFIATLT